MFKKSFIIFTLCALTTPHAHAAQNNAVQNNGQDLRGAGAMAAAFCVVCYLNTRVGPNSGTCSGGICQLPQPNPQAPAPSAVCIQRVVGNDGQTVEIETINGLENCPPEDIRYVASPSAMFPKNNDQK
jgi:hypothetical protein